jgi:hypothetical protein
MKPNFRIRARCGTVCSFDVPRDADQQLLSSEYRFSDRFDLLLPDISHPVPAMGRRPLRFPTVLYRKPSKVRFYSRDGPAI